MPSITFPEYAQRIEHILNHVVGAGEGELVAVAQGSSARQTHLTQSAPVDATIMAIADSLKVGGTVTYRKA